VLLKFHDCGIRDLPAELAYNFYPELPALVEQSAENGRGTPGTYGRIPAALAVDETDLRMENRGAGSDGPSPLQVFVYEKSGQADV